MKKRQVKQAKRDKALDRKEIRARKRAAIKAARERMGMSQDSVEIVHLPEQ